MSGVTVFARLALLEGTATSELPAGSWMVLGVREMKVLLVEVAISRWSFRSLASSSVRRNMTTAAFPWEVVPPLRGMVLPAPLGSHWIVI